MRLLLLQLAEFRNFQRLELALDPGLSIFAGENAQGKTNLLEAVHLLSTFRDPFAGSDLQLIRRPALDSEPVPVARVVGRADGAAGPLKVEVAIAGRPANGGWLASKTIRINGVPRRSWEAAGALATVLFTVRDLDLITGAPSLRRRYLDGALSQLDQAYGAARQRFEKVLQQRNHLLKRLREGAARPSEMEFWDDQLAQDGGYMLWARARQVAALEALAVESHSLLGAGEQPGLRYIPKLTVGGEDLGSAAEARAALLRDLKASLQQQVAAGATLAGPHRDDIALTLDGMPAAAFGSRAQQRTLALALRLAEANQLKKERNGEPPLLLLDDIFSELDSGRRRRVMTNLVGFDQILLTMTELDRLPAGVVPSRIYAVRQGQVSEEPAAITAEK